MSGVGIRLESDRLVLREFVVTDESAVHSHASDPTVTQFMDWGPNSIESTRAFLREAIKQVEEARRCSFDLAVVDRETQTLIGGARLSVTSAEHHRGELGYVLRRESWSKGFATEVSRLLLRFGFDRLHLQRISATCHPDNRASARVLEKSGFSFEGRMRNHLLVHGQWRDSLLYAATHDDRSRPHHDLEDQGF